LRISYLRAEIDAEIAIAYGLCIEDMEVIMSDFPLLDRGQTPLKRRKKSTITRDLILATLARKLGFNSTTWQARKDEATSVVLLLIYLLRPFLKKVVSLLKRLSIMTNTASRVSRILF
jgi:hypothetical protein